MNINNKQRDSIKEVNPQAPYEKATPRYPRKEDLQHLLIFLRILKIVSSNSPVKNLAAFYAVCYFNFK